MDKVEQKSTFESKDPSQSYEIKRWSSQKEEGIVDTINEIR